MISIKSFLVEFSTEQETVITHDMNLQSEYSFVLSAYRISDGKQVTVQARCVDCNNTAVSAMPAQNEVLDLIVTIIGETAQVKPLVHLQYALGS